LEQDLGHTKLIEDEHIELVQVDDDMDVGTFRKRRGTIRSEVYNNSENLFIQQRDLVDKLLTSTETLKIENEKFNKIIEKSACDELHKDLKSHGEAISEQVEILKKIHEDLANTFGRNQSNNTIRPFISPSKSIFLPSSTPYVNKDKSKPLMLSKSGEKFYLKIMIIK
jgi:small-conductance mechanosensitive channel